MLYGLIETPKYLTSKLKKIDYLVEKYRQWTSEYNMLIVDYLNDLKYVYKV